MYHATQQVIFLFVPLKNDFKKYFMFFIHFRHTKDTFFIIIILPKKESTYSWPEKLQFADVSPTYFVFIRTKAFYNTQNAIILQCVIWCLMQVCVCGWPEHFSHVRLSSLTMYLFIRNNKMFYISSSRHATNNMGVLVSKFSHLKLALASKTNIDVNVTFYIWTRVLWWGNIIFMRNWMYRY